MLGVAKTPPQSTHPLLPPTPSGQTYMGPTSEPCGSPSRPPSPLGPDLSRVARHPDCSRQAEQCEEYSAQHLIGWMGRPGGGPAAVAWLAAREISRQPEKSVGWPRGPLGWLGVSVRWPRMRQAVSAPSHPAIQPSSQPLHHAASPPAAQPDRPQISRSAVAAWQPARLEIGQDSDRFPN